MKDMRAVRRNEKIKRLSTILGTAAAALFIAASSRWLVDGADGWTVAWISSAFATTYIAVQFNELIESEDEE